MNLQQCITAWNAQADQYNQWDALDADERCEWVIEQSNFKFEKIKALINNPFLKGTPVFILNEIKKII